MLIGGGLSMNGMLFLSFLPVFIKFPNSLFISSLNLCVFGLTIVRSPSYAFFFPSCFQSLLSYFMDFLRRIFDFVLLPLGEIGDSYKFSIDHVILSMAEEADGMIALYSTNKAEEATVDINSENDHRNLFEKVLMPEESLRPLLKLYIYLQSDNMSVLVRMNFCLRALMEFLYAEVEFKGCFFANSLLNISSKNRGDEKMSFDGTRRCYPFLMWCDNPNFYGFWQTSSCFLDAAMELF